MAILSRVKISPQQRFDLEDFFAGQSAARTDSKLWTQKFLTDTNMVLAGFSVSGIGLTQATIAMTDAAFVFPQNTFDFSYFISSPTEPDVVIPGSSLVDSSRNYVEALLTTQDGTPLTKAFWDPEANSGLGLEFNQIVNTITNLKCSFVTSTGGFSGNPDRIPIAIIDCDGSGTIKLILDRRELFGRLAKPNDLDNSYAWGTKVDPVYNLNMTSVTGTFVAGETITIGGETATVVSGGTTSITFTAPTGINFTNGSSVAGGTSGATGTVNTVLESFTGVDKSLKDQKTINDALMTELKNVKGTRFWWQDSATAAGLKNEVSSIIAPMTSSAYVSWDGSNLVISDGSLTPADSDVVAAIRLLASTHDLLLTRQDNGKEVVTITLPQVPDAGTLTLNQNGHLIAINWDDSTSTIQSTWNGSGAYSATISGSPAAKLITITANSTGPQVDVIQSSNTLTHAGSSVTPSISIKQGMAADGSIAIADGEFLYVDLPTPLADRTFSDVGIGSTNYKVAARGALANNDQGYWLAYREGSKLMWRGAGELNAGETSDISNNVPQSLLDSIGLVSETSSPAYPSDIRGVQSESIVKRVGVLTDAAGDEQEDRSGYLRSDDLVQWTGTQVAFTADIILEFINTKNGTLTKHRATFSNSPVTLNDGESMWMLVDRDATDENCTVHRSSITAIPAQTQANKDVFVLFRRVDVSSVAYLHVPFMKSLMLPGQSVRLGQSGSGSGIQKVTYHDPISTTLPSGPAVTIDGIAGVDGDLVLFSNLSSGNNEVYKLGGVGVSITWTAQSFFNGSSTPTAGDMVIPTAGTSFAESIGIFNGTNWKFNDVVRYFSGADFWEQSSLKTSTLTDNSTGNIFTVTAAGSENIIVDFSIIRNSIKETGTIWLTNDGTNAFFTSGGAFSGATGVTFSADISGGNVRLRYTLTSTGFNATMKYSVKRWSDAAGGPTGIPSYTGAAGVTPAAGSDGEVQFNTSGFLDSNPQFKFDTVDPSVNLAGLRQTVLSGGITILDNQASPANLFTYDASYRFAIMEYSIFRNGSFRTGNLLIANDGLVASSNGLSIDTGSTGVTLSTIISGSNVQVQYTSTNTGVGATFKYSLRKWS